MAAAPNIANTHYAATEGASSANESGLTETIKDQATGFATWMREKFEVRGKDRGSEEAYLRELLGAKHRGFIPEKSDS